MVADLKGLVEDVSISLEIPNTEIWKLMFEIYKLDLNESIERCDIVYGTFQKHLKNVKRDIVKGDNILGQIYTELRIMANSKQFDDINTEEINSCLTKIQALFGSPRDIKLKESLNSRADQFGDMLNHQMEVLNEKRKDVNKVVTVSLTTAGLGFASFATAVGASAKAMVYKNLTSRWLLGLSGGSLFLASVSQLAEYVNYDKSFNGIIYDLTKLKESLTDLLNWVDDFGVQLTDVLEEIKRYSQETKEGTNLIGNNAADNETLLAKVTEMFTKAKSLQKTFLRLELYTEDSIEYVKTGRADLPKKRVLNRRFEKTE